MTLFEFMTFCWIAVSDTSVVEGESQIQMGRFISFLQVWHYDFFCFLKKLLSPKHFDFFWLLCNRSCLALCHAVLRWWSTWFTSWLLCTTAASEKCKIFTCYVVLLQCGVAELFVFLHLRGATKIIESTGVHFQVIFIFSVVFMWFFTDTWRVVLKLSLSTLRQCMSIWENFWWSSSPWMRSWRTTPHWGNTGRCTKGGVGPFRCWMNVNELKTK